MKTLYFDCFSGISGDMTVAALLDFGVPQSIVTEGIAKLNIAGYRLEFPRANKRGIDAARFCVLLEESHHVHDHHDHRDMTDIEGLLRGSELPREIVAQALEVFWAVARAEGKIHGLPPEQVHFHEVGAVDSIVDIVAVCLCLQYLQPDKVVFSPLREGCGFVKCQHGLIPVPAPATLEILQSCGAPVVFSEVPHEMITPTGAGLAAALGDEWGKPCPSGKILAAGYGAGTRDLPHPNVLRAILIEEEGAAPTDTVCELCATLDDVSGEVLGHAAEKLLSLGALEVYLTPVYMKKNRPGQLLTVLCRPQDEAMFVDALFRHTPTIGLRTRQAARHVMEREVRILSTPYGQIPVKTCRYGDIVKQKPEFDAARALAEQAHVSVQTVLDAVKNDIQYEEL